MGIAYIQKYLTFFIKNYILRFNIPMDDHFFVEVLETKDDGSNKESGLYLSKLMLFGDMITQIPTIHEIHHQIERGSILEGIEHINKIFMLESGQKSSFIDDGINTSLGNDSTQMNTYVALDISFIAKTCPELMCLTFHTFPKPPLPIIFRYLQLFLCMNYLVSPTLSVSLRRLALNFSVFSFSYR